MPIQPTGSFDSEPEADLAIPDGKWSIRLTHLAIVTSDDFAEVRGSLKRVALALGGLYDGWEAAAKP